MHGAVDEHAQGYSYGGCRASGRLWVLMPEGAQRKLYYKTLVLLMGRSLVVLDPFMHQIAPTEQYLGYQKKACPSHIP